MKRRSHLKIKSLAATIRDLLIRLVAIFLITISTMMIFEQLSFKDSFWYVWTAISTTGFGDITPKGWIGRLITIGFVYIGGIFTLADFVAKVDAYRQYRREQKLKGTWRWKLKDHIVIIGSPDTHADQFFNRIVEQIRQHTVFKDTPIQILTQSFQNGLPDKIRNQQVVHFDGSGATDDDLKAVSIDSAIHVIIIADHDTDYASDSRTLDILSRLDDLGFLGTSVVECVNDQNRNRARRYGADSVVRPARGYPEMLVRALVSPGSEVILEEFFDTGGSEICRVDLNGVVHLEWKDVVTKVAGAGVGIPVGFIDGEEIKINPGSRALCHTSTLFVIMDDQTAETCQKVEDCLAGSSKPQLAA